MDELQHTVPAAPSRLVIHCPKCLGHEMLAVLIRDIAIRIECASPLCGAILVHDDSLAGRAMGLGVRG